MTRHLLTLLLVAGAGMAAGCQRRAAPPPPPSPAPAPPLSLALVPLPAPASGDGKLDAEIRRIQAALRAGPRDAETWARLARAFVHKARQSGQSALYAQAKDAADQALLMQPAHPAALEVRQAVLLNEHRFAEARRLAEEIVRRAPADAVAWGTLGDSALELGDYQTAADAYQRMVDLKPDLRSYSRGAWMRWLVGDGDGAVELMATAAQSGRGEPRAFCLVQLGDLRAHRGAYDQARAAYEEALSEQPGYAPALAARGRLHLAGGRTGEALADLEAALRVQPTTATRAAYVEALWAAGREAQAREELARLDREGRREDPRALALFYASHDLEPALALSLAQREAAARPDIFSLDVLAWALYRNGRLDEAWAAIQQATRLGTRDPRMRYHRGRIAAARAVVQGAARAEARSEAIEQLKLALQQSPRWDRSEPGEARAALAQLKGL
jgi:tetratricopeptide (TPR) repeat protein